MTIKELQKKYKEYKGFSAITDEIDNRAAAYGENEDQEALEKEWDEAYINEHEAWDEVVKGIQELVGCTFETAKKILHSERFEELMRMRVID